MSPDIRDLFDVAADDSGRTLIDADALLSRGRRKVRARRASAAVGSAAVLVAAVVGVSQLPTLSADGPVPPADTPTVPQPTSRPTVTTPSPTPITPPNLPPRDSLTGAQVLEKLTYAEGVRRCQARFRAEKGEPGTPNPPEPIDVGQGLQYGMYVTDLLPMKLKDGSETYCPVPGMTASNSVQGDPKAFCAALTWLDLTDWLITSQADGQGGWVATLMSPDRKAVLVCDRDSPGLTRGKTTAFPNAYVYLIYGPASGQRVGSAPNGNVGSGLDATPIHFLGAVKAGRQFWGGGGIAAPKSVRYALYAGSRKLAEAPVEHGVYAMRVWLPARVGEPTEVQVYDAAGAVIERYMPY